MKRILSSKNKFTAFLVSLTLLLSCADNSGNQPSDDSESESTEFQAEFDEVDSKRALLVESIIRSSPNLVETSEIFAEAGSDFDRNILNDINNVNNYVTLREKGINLGVYLADLGYITSYEQSQEVIFYMNCAQKLAEGIGVSDVFNEETVERMEMNINDKDSLLKMISDLYWKTDAFLKELGRENISALIICGGWVEGMHIGSSMVKAGEANDVIFDKIMHQKGNLKKILKLLATFDMEDEHIKFFVDKLSPIEAEFDAIGDHDESQGLSDEQKAALTEIAGKLEELRSEII